MAQSKNIIIRTTRKAFTFQYCLGIALAVGGIMSYQEGFFVLPEAAYVGLVALGFVIAGWPEVHRKVNYIEVFPNQVIHNQGLIARNQVSMIGTRVVAMHLDQNWYQRVFGYGDLTIKSINKELKILADRPHKIIPMIKKHMKWAGE